MKLRPDDAREILHQLVTGRRYRVAIGPSMVAAFAVNGLAEQDYAGRARWDEDIWNPKFGIYGFATGTQGCGLDQVFLRPKQKPKAEDRLLWFHSIKSLDELTDDSVERAIEMLCAWSEAAEMMGRT